MKNVIMIIIIACSVLFAQEAPKFEYVGANKCKVCHSSKKKGAQYKKWETTAHAKSYETLLTDEAKEIAKAKGMKEEPHLSGECLQCHVTGWEKGGYEIKDDTFWNPADDDRKGKKAAKRMLGLQSVGCEVCHGPGSAYKSMKVMDAIYEGTTYADSVGLLTPDEATCVQCHNEESPSYQPFNFEYRVKEIAHPYPPDMGLD
ncbi:MAG: cytochrome c family protein [Candidatus Marinimicrobia bacterium]|nr:cytochrome c family protein [Candidatus Neomarinimicrobiota bacterium]